MASTEEVVSRLRSYARPDQLEGMARYGIAVEKRLGLSVPDMRKMARELGRDHRLALDLWNTGIDDARIVAGMIDDPRELTEKQMEEWVKGLNSWDVCDQLCMNLFDKTPLAWKKIIDWSEREEEFVRRAAFALLACLAWHDKQATDEQFIEFLPVIVQAASDERNFVKKAVSWALRNIGKRSKKLNQAALDTARAIQRIDSKAARWIASGAVKELESEAVRARLKR